MPDHLIIRMAGTWVDIPGGWVTLIVALLTVVVSPALLAVVTARLSSRVKSMRHDVAVTKDQVANDHVDDEGNPINMRVEQDDRHDEIMTTLGEVKKDIGGIRHDIRTLYSADAEQVRQTNRDRERIDAMEKTIPRDELGRFVKKNDA